MRIDLTNETFVPGKKNYERVRVALEERLRQNFDVILLWDPPGIYIFSFPLSLFFYIIHTLWNIFLNYLNISDTKICPSSIAAWFYAHNYSVCLCHQKFSQKIEYSITIPILQEESSIDRFFEWLGVFSIGDIQYVYAIKKIMISLSLLLISNTTYNVFLDLMKKRMIM